MPDIPHRVPSTGETRYKHITSGQQRLMSTQKWEQTVRNQRAAKQHDHSESGTYRLTSNEQTVLIYPDGCRSDEEIL